MKSNVSAVQNIDFYIVLNQRRSAAFFFLNDLVTLSSRRITFITKPVT